MKRVLYLIASGLLIASVVGVAPASAQGQNQAPGRNRGTTDSNFPVQGTGTTTAGVPADFTGNFQVSKFQVVNGQLMAVGHLTGAVTAAGVETPVPGQDVSLPVKSINGKSLPGASGAETLDETGAAGMTIAQVASCDVLNLVLGPLHLDLLGLVVDLNQVLLDITGQPGPGNLVGNLLCAITGLLDRAGTLSIIANLLQSILDILNLP